jgi:hypothetical protein
MLSLKRAREIGQLPDPCVGSLPAQIKLAPQVSTPSRLAPSLVQASPSASWGVQLGTFGSS